MYEIFTFTYMKPVGSPVVYLTVFIIDLSLQLRRYLYVPNAHVSDYIIFSAIQHCSEGNNSFCTDFAD